MLKTLHLKRVSVFHDECFDFSPRLNVIVGDNGTGKTHALKSGYLLAKALGYTNLELNEITEEVRKRHIRHDFLSTFKLFRLGSLISKDTKDSLRLVAEINTKSPSIVDISVRTFPQNLMENIDIHILRDTALDNSFYSQIFIPSRDIISSIGDPLEGSCSDLYCLMYKVKGESTSSFFHNVTSIIYPFINGHLVFNERSLIFETSDGYPQELSLMSEGYLNLAILGYLLDNGGIIPGSTIFWDNPETGLNPVGIKVLAEILFKLAGLDVQVILTTHSLFLMQEFEILQKVEERIRPYPIRYFGLGFQSGKVTLSQGDDITFVNPILLLDAVLDQSDRYMSVG